MCYTYVLATYYLYTNYMIPLQRPTHPTGGCGGKFMGICDILPPRSLEFPCRPKAQASTLFQCLAAGRSIEGGAKLPLSEEVGQQEVLIYKSGGIINQDQN